MSCYFCSEFNSSTDPQSRIIWEDDDFLVLPTMGCFTPGYCLLMPRDHVLSFANLPLDQLRGGLKVAEQWRGKIEKRFGQTVIAEHGAGECGLNGAACCDHAHLHLIPVHGRIGQVSRQYLDAGGSPTVLAEPEEVCRLSGAPYILLSPRPGQWWIWQELVRRVSTSVRSPSLCWRSGNWGVFRLANPYIQRKHGVDEERTGRTTGSLDSWSQRCWTSAGYAFFLNLPPNSLAERLGIEERQNGHLSACCGCFNFLRWTAC